MPIFDSVRNFVQSATEAKVKEATDDNETSGATGTLMNEISVLTYSPKTLKEIIQVLKKRLTGSSKKSSHRNCVHILKTMTLISYLINNGSNDFIAWARSNIMIFEVLKDFEVIHEDDEKMAEQIRYIAGDLCILINDDELLEARRKDVIQFRSSISSPGRKSTDNSHLKKTASAGTGKNDLTHMLFKKSSNSNAEDEYFYSSNYSNQLRGGTTSLELKREGGNTSRRSTQENARFEIYSVAEEDTVVEKNSSKFRSSPLKISTTNPFR
ncbi:hypothetical protein Kpol_388p5 [Vanderwaltozyma polyspora DSM 70294]|uniref:ENTH domain-containing protein n=1 Tax=Vanderwaltozyma polyspora (strain ATCC 22028 / DSM 70294 / BCRC 21397 / CBS 2163 / NBRC 10782 / NRRL Y-8283 / UCD 57-17) TaxID=436907 RepID=A7TRZ4_VANPO|nr:uncharacterized protein Kpol_388p5 [Vanderwaltozyma polyspora DSM 70294]EDO14962.1 hypothetical protein Kpol_388p5 [Vanderwaltozyma polyspora DSM 70294]